MRAGAAASPQAPAAMGQATAATAVTAKDATAPKASDGIAANRDRAEHARQASHRSQRNMPYLEHDGVTRELPQGQTLVGSGSDVDWRLQTINVAPRHFAVHVDSAGVAVLTPYRTHDVDVNGAPVTRAPRTGSTAMRSSPAPASSPFCRHCGAERRATGSVQPVGNAYLIDIGAGLAYPLSDETITIGRDPVNHVAIRDPAPCHAISRGDSDACPIEAASRFARWGRAGSTVNGAPIGGSARAACRRTIWCASLARRFASRQHHRRQSCGS